MIIAFAGRLRSGKTELSKICENYGYERIYFALPLKRLIAHLIDGTIEDVNKLKNVEKNYKLDEEQLQYVSNETDIPFDTVKNVIGGAVFRNTREMLQIIGTDLIRGFNNDWHVNKVREMIDPTHNYVIDDMRFPNEKLMVDMLGGISFFVVRPNGLDNVSNHISESSLHWQEFSNIIVNDRSLDYLTFRWEQFMKNGIGESLMSRASLINKINTNLKYKEDFMSISNDMNMFDMFFINKCEYTYNPKFSMGDLTDVEKIENFNNCIFRVYYKNGNIDVISNPLMIEDLKFYL